MIFCWDQDLLGYHFQIVRQSKKFITDVDSLTRRFGKLISQYCIIASILYITYKHRQPKSYEESVFTKENIVKNYLGHIKAKSNTDDIHDSQNKNPIRIGNEFGIRYSSLIRLSRVSPIRHHLFSHYLLSRIEHKSNYT